MVRFFFGVCPAEKAGRDVRCVFIFSKKVLKHSYGFSIQSTVI